MRFFSQGLFRCDRSVLVPLRRPDINSNISETARERAASLPSTAARVRALQGADARHRQEFVHAARGGSR